MFHLSFLLRKTLKEDSGSNSVPGVASPQALSSAGAEGLLPTSISVVPTSPHRGKV